MGRVYRARDSVLERDVALKVLRPDVEGPELTRRLSREARILALLEHPGIVPVHDTGTLSDGRTFYVMKLVRGTRLDHFIRGKSESEILRVFLRVCDAVGFAHAHGVIHRDLKPANVMVGAFGEVLVLDWGIARLLGAPRRDVNGAAEAPAEIASAGSNLGEPEATGAGAVLGTPGFMSPEQATGDSGMVGDRSDVYALGAMLQALVGGGAGAPLASICRRATMPLASDRYPGAAELAAEVTRYIDSLPVHAHHETLGERAGRVYRKYQTAILLVMAYLVMRLLFLISRGF